MLDFFDDNLEETPSESKRTIHRGFSPSKSRRTPSKKMHLAEAFKKSISGKQRLPYCIESADPSDVRKILPDGYLFSPYTDYSYTLFPYPGLITLKGVPFDNPTAKSQCKLSNCPMILAIIQKQASFSPSHIEIYWYDSHLPQKYYHLSALSLSAVNQFCSDYQLACAPASLQRYLLHQVALLWGIVPSYLPKHTNPVACFHPATANTWRSELGRQMHLQAAYPFVGTFYNELNAYARQLSFYWKAMDGYMHPSPPILQFLTPYNEPPEKNLFADIAKQCLRSQSVCFVLIELIYLHLHELGLFGRSKRILDQDKMIFCCSDQLSEGLRSHLPSKAFLRLGSQHDLERAVRRARAQTGKKPHTFLCLNCAPQYAKQFTVYELLPFLQNCQVLILCGGTAPEECCTLPLSTDLFDSAAQVPGGSVFDAQFHHALRSLLQYCLNQLLFQRYQAIHQKMILSSFEGLSFTPPPADSTAAQDPPWEAAGYLTAARCANYVLTIEKNASLAKKAAMRMDTLLIPFRRFCLTIPGGKRLIRKRQTWGDLLTCGLFLDHIIEQGTAFDFTVPGTCRVVSALVEPSSPPAKNLFDLFCRFVRGLPLCDSRQTYFAQKDTPNACLGWKDCSTIYLDYDRFWPAFCSFAFLPTEQLDARNRFLRESFRPGMPGGQFAYATDSRDGHWGHRIRKSKNEKALGRFLRLRIEILQR